MSCFLARRFAPIWIAAALASGASAQLRVATWNITNWANTAAGSQSSARISAFQTAIYGTVPAGLALAGRSFAPDVLFLQEVDDTTSLSRFVNLLNTAAGSPGDWVAVPFVNGPDSESVMVYRSSKITPVAGTPTIVANGTTTTTDQPRNTYRFDFRLVGYGTGNNNLISVYNVHMKSGSTSDDQARRLLEAQRIRQNANGLSARAGVMVMGDFNIQSALQAAYQELVGSQMNNAGRFFDPINSDKVINSTLNGVWNNNSAYRFIHTQDPWPGTGSGGMDDRLDMILATSELLDGEGLHYIGNPSLPFSTTTWNDLNHSYRCWGNDGGGFNGGLRISGNTMVGATLAQALVNTLGNQSGHLPVYMDLRVPPVAQTNVVTLDFGFVDQGTAATAELLVNNVGNMSLWGLDGIADLQYSFNTAGNFFGPSGNFSDRADDGPKTHLITMNTQNPGRINGTVTLNTNDPLRPTITVNCTGVVIPRIVRN